MLSPYGPRVFDVWNVYQPDDAMHVVRHDHELVELCPFEVQRDCIPGSLDSDSGLFVRKEQLAVVATDRDEIRARRRVVERRQAECLALGPAGVHGPKRLGWPSSGLW